jgi:hypothetical protein
LKIEHLKIGMVSPDFAPSPDFAETFFARDI